MIREKFMLPFLLSELNYSQMAFSSDNYANSLISLNLNYRFSKAVRYQLRYGKCIGIRCKIE